MRGFVLLLTIVALAACETAPQGPTLRDQVDSWIGHSESELVASKGPPTATAVIDGGDRVLSWDISRPQQMTGAFIAGTYVPGPAVSVSCRITYRVSEGVIVASSLTGNC
jgi:hypothetical protein